MTKFMAKGVFNGGGKSSDCRMQILQFKITDSTQSVFGRSEEITIHGGSITDQDSFIEHIWSTFPNSFKGGGPHLKITIILED